MRSTCIIVLIASLIACQKGDFLPRAPFSAKAVTDLPFRVKSLAYPAYQKGVQYRATATYHYDGQNRLLRIDSLSQDRNVVYTYTNNQLTERLTTSTTDGAVFFRETFVYGPSGQLLSSLWTANGSTTEYRYTYDSAGHLSAKETNALSYKYKHTEQYRWENDNLVAMTDYDEKGQKRSEWSYTYDQQANYQALLPISPNPDDAFAQTRNNRVSTTLNRDYTGLIDLIANPVASQFSYNTNALPSRITTSYSDYYTELVYEDKR